jgi:2-dehydro-3-deoxyglucarate aldolase/4-hydroxy-2-oxoheptanedioate aldolase
VVEKMRRYHDRTLLIAQIETEMGLQNVEEIAAVDGVDVLWVGHFDLSNFMGIPGQFDHPKFSESMTHVAKVAKKHGKVAGFMATDATWIERAKGMGYTLLAAGTDTALLQQAFGQLIQGIQSTGVD